MDSALGKSENKCRKTLENSRNIQKMDNYVQNFIHIPKLNFWGVTELPPLNRISSRDSLGLVTKRRDRVKRFHQGYDKRKQQLWRKGENFD